MPRLRSIALVTPARSKTCTSCNKVLEATTDNFHHQKNGKFGLTSKCKACKNVQIKEWVQLNPEKSRAQKLRWKAANYEKYLQVKRSYQHERKSALKEKIKYEDWMRILERFDYKCLRCGEIDDLTQDHVVPLSKGGRNHISNIQPLCRVCNSWKNTKTIDFRGKVI
jgi:5-methylcytosine-specific restriction endonuclease McrA